MAVKKQQTQWRWNDKSFDPMKTDTNVSEVFVRGKARDLKYKLDELKELKINVKRIETTPISYEYRIILDKPSLLEEWRDIPGHEGRYQISSNGRIRSTKIVAEYYTQAILTDKYQNRKTKSVKNMYKEVFGKELPTPEYSRRKKKAIEEKNHA